ncbi:MAG TPA: FAD binding domain-containing protein, partial [Nannocystaceae bacterium]|nr:FAD binding domain-containing protein [Nannocystaceae bacterium]
GRSQAWLVDLRDVKGNRAIEERGGGMVVGALAKIAELADHDRIKSGYPGLAEAAGGLATPQIRAMATVGGNLLQRTRCWYYRAPESQCFKTGGNACRARSGDHLFHACFDLGPCISVHPSTLGMALMAYEATVEVIGQPSRTIAELFGDGSDPSRDHQLPEGAVLAEIVLPPPKAGEQSAYMRAISRARAEWPLVEVLARVGVTNGAIAWARLAVGGVAPVPLRLHAVETALVGAPADASALVDIAARSTDGAKPLPMTGYKLDLLHGSIIEALERALASKPVGGA